MHSFLYAPQFSIDSKFICDPFPYEQLKNPNLLLTDTKITSKIPVVKTFIEAEFRKRFVEALEKQKNIFIPSDSANISIELLIRIEKILDEYYFNKNKETSSNMFDVNNSKREYAYKVLVCGYSAPEIIESVKSLIEFMGTSIAQRFYGYNDNPFNLQYVQSVKDLKEYQEIKIKNSNINKFIVISSFESLSFGLSYKLLPLILTDEEFNIFIVTRSYKNSVLREIAKRVKDGVKIYQYKDVKRVVDVNAGSISPRNHSQGPFLVTNEKQIFKVDKSKNQELNQQDNIQTDTEIKNKELKDIKKFANNDLSIKKKLFAKGPHPMFAYHKKRKINEYGMVILSY